MTISGDRKYSLQGTQSLLLNDIEAMMVFWIVLLRCQQLGSVHLFVSCMVTVTMLCMVCMRLRHMRVPHCRLPVRQ